MSNEKAIAQNNDSYSGAPRLIRTIGLRLRRPPIPTNPTTFTEVCEYVHVRHMQLMLGSVAVIFSRQTTSERK